PEVRRWPARRHQSRVVGAQQGSRPGVPRRRQGHDAPVVRADARERKALHDERLSGRAVLADEPLRQHAGTHAPGRLLVAHVQDGRPVRERVLMLERLGVSRLTGAAIGAAVVLLLFATGHKEDLVIGVITGLAYSLIALGLVLIYKSSGIFNF